MLSKLIGEKRVYSLLLIAYSALALGLTFNKVVLSLATILLFLIVLLDFNFQNYKKAILQNKIIQVLLLFLLLHLLSFFWSENVEYFLKDLNSKLPFYTIPLVFVLKPIREKKQTYIIFATFLFSLTLLSLINFISYYGWRKTEFDDIRNLSLFVSHIRFGLMLVFGIILSTFWLYSKELKFKIIPILLIFWFLIYTYFSEVLSSYLALFGVIFVAIIYKIFKSENKKKYILALTILVVSLFTSFYILKTNIEKTHTKPKLNELQKYTKGGNEYEHYLEHNHFINGNLVFVNISGKELFRDWSKYSKTSLNDTAQNGNSIYFTLIQYMTSKGLKKDAEGLRKLSKKDFKNIELGKVKFKDDSDGFLARLNTIFNEFYDDNPNGKTILQRVEYLKAGKSIFFKNLIFGVGSGDLQDEFNKQYEQSNSKLLPENRLRTHNQIFTYFISFGIIGGFIFLLLFYVSIRYFIRSDNFLALLFTSEILISFLSEDTLETQMGATFFALFFGLFISSTKILKDEN
jgi:hypothetical protein